MVHLKNLIQLHENRDCLNGEIDYSKRLTDEAVYDLPTCRLEIFGVKFEL